MDSTVSTKGAAETLLTMGTTRRIVGGNDSIASVMEFAGVAV